MGISGKSDFQDICEMHHTPEQILKNYKVYAYNNTLVPLQMISKKDLVAYYPYIVTIMGKFKDDGVIWLSEKSYIDTSEEKKLNLDLETLIRYWKKCKRNHKEFDKNEALKMIVWPTDDIPEDYEIELVDRVAEYGAKATIDDLHDSYHDRMRNEWYQLMIDAGWNKQQAYKWVYGWKRYFDNDEIIGLENE